MTRSFTMFEIMCLHCLLLIAIVVGQNDNYDNIALRKPSEQSTTNGEREAHFAVDNDLKTCSMTNGSANDWWEVDLGQHHHIQDITIITIDLKPGVYSTSIYVDGLMCSNIIENTSVTVPVRCNHTIYGQKVRVTKEHRPNATDKYLVICEFIVSDTEKSTALERTTETALSTATERTTETALSTATEREKTKATTHVNAVEYDTNLVLIGGVASVIVVVIIIIVIIIIIMIGKRKRPCEKMSPSDAIDSGGSSSKPDSGLKPQVGGDSVKMIDCVIYEATDVRMK